jgi:solute carrier family 25 phosphate transporter 23/24/25/41
MGVEEAGRKKLALASIGFADVRVGAAVPGAAAGYKDGLLVVGLPVPKDDGLDAAAARVVGDLAARLPDVGAAARVSNWSRLQISVVSVSCFLLCSGIWMDVL